MAVITLNAAGIIIAPLSITDIGIIIWTRILGAVNSYIHHIKRLFKRP